MMKKLITWLKAKLQTWLEIKKESQGIDYEQEIEKVLDKRPGAPFRASIGVEDLDDVFLKMPESEKKSHIAEASLIFANPVFKLEMKRMFGKQALRLAVGTQDPEELRYFEAIGFTDHEQSILGRGTLNGISLVEERFNELNSMHLEELQKPKQRVEDKDKYNLMPQA